MSSPSESSPVQKDTDIAAERRRWQQGHEAVAETYAGEFSSLSGIPLQALYTPVETAGLDYRRELGFPGEAPFTRGIHATMYRGRKWTMRQLAGFGPPEATNQRYRLLLQEGATGINGVFDYPTLRGYDSTEPLARADAGRGGVAIDTLDDMSTLFAGIPIERISTSLVTSTPLSNITLQSMFFANALKRGIALAQLQGTSQNDFLMETVVCVAPEVLPPAISFKLCCDAIEFCTLRGLRWNPVSFSGYNYREAGCRADQEVAYVIANALACAEELRQRGCKI
ncbi:MAG: methylmalonyl-CoA mutase, partial [Deltaproteobacteria bacterium]|nr:methylmalonyl-CoA mutase [Deltaproteobacteria bacterium]